MADIAYFDNAATTFPKPKSVYEFADSFYRSSGGNIGRGGNPLAVAAGSVARQAKDNLRQIYQCPASEVVFTASATDALNRIIFGLGLGRGDAVYVTPFEHNAVTRPLNHLVQASGVCIKVLSFDHETLLPNWDEIKAQFDEEHPRALVMTHVSNVCGAVVPVEELCTIAKDYGATTVVDMSQTAGLLELPLASDVFDYAVFAGHKTLLGPFGVGGFICKHGAKLSPVFFGGNGINSIEQDLPDDIVQMEEIGSQNTYAIAGLKASTDWILKLGVENVRAKEQEARNTLLECLEDFGAEVIGRVMKCERIGVVSALFDDYNPDEVEMILGRYGVAVRSGIQCAPYAHRFLNTLPSGTVRFSVSSLTAENDFTMLRDALAVLRDAG